MNQYLSKIIKPQNLEMWRRTSQGGFGSMKEKNDNNSANRVSSQLTELGMWALANWVDSDKWVDSKQIK